jgi:hypothetical protein
MSFTDNLHHSFMTSARGGSYRPLQGDQNEQTTWRDRWAPESVARGRGRVTAIVRTKPDESGLDYRRAADSIVFTT